MYPISFQSGSLLLAMPEIVLALSACLILAIDVYYSSTQRGLTAMLTMLAVLAAGYGVAAVAQWRRVEA
jgi:NADH:ubiquinone oxidoreductase subunit 2 (subunit N)